MTIQSLQLECELPSRGLLYGEALPDGKVLISPMTTADEKLLAGGTGDRVALIDTLLERKLVPCGVPYDDFLVGDKIYMLLFLRSITYGTDYTFKVKCKGCNNFSAVTIQVPDGFHVKRLTEGDVEPFEVELPFSKRKVSLRLMRVRDEKEVQRYLKRNSGKLSKEQGDPTYILRLSKHIVAIDGKDVSPVDALSFCEEMHGGDSVTIANTIDEHDPGVDLRIEQNCSICGFSSEEIMPFTNEFFRPKSQNLL